MKGMMGACSHGAAGGRYSTRVDEQGHERQGQATNGRMHVLAVSISRLSPHLYLGGSLTRVRKDLNVVMVGLSFFS